MKAIAKAKVRAEPLNSSVLDKDEEMKHLRQALTSIGYPKAMIHRHLIRSSSRAVDLSDTQGPVVTLPYVHGVSEAVRRILTPLGAKVSFRPHTALRHLLMRPKDRDADLNQQLGEHKAVESGEPATSALAEHAWGAHHPVDWDKVRVLDHQPHHHPRLILESIHIRSQTRPLNRETGSMPQIYNSLFFK